MGEHVRLSFGIFLRQPLCLLFLTPLPFLLFTTKATTTIVDPGEGTVHSTKKQKALRQPHKGYMSCMYTSKYHPVIQHPAIIKCIISLELRDSEIDRALHITYHPHCRFATCVQASNQAVVSPHGQALAYNPPSRPRRPAYPQ